VFLQIKESRQGILTLEGCISFIGIASEAGIQILSEKLPPKLNYPLNYQGYESTRFKLRGKAGPMDFCSRKISGNAIHQQKLPELY
jgi:hypothetical protein